MRFHNDMSSYVDEVQKTPIFGSRISKEPVRFVSASNASEVEPKLPPRSLGEKYLAIVLKGRQDSKVTSATACEGKISDVKDTPTDNDVVRLCDLCRMPRNDSGSQDQGNLDKAHDISLAHQVCIHHSYPPSHLDRKSSGLKYLASYGWDVDSRKGLGASGNGRLAPLKPVPKDNTVGLGMAIPKGAKCVPKPVLLDAGKIRKRQIVDKQKRARLQEMFYETEDVEKYLAADLSSR